MELTANFKEQFPWSSNIAVASCIIKRKIYKQGWKEKGQKYADVQFLGSFRRIQNGSSANEILETFTKREQF